jgi:histidinol-phosphatase (PHP family)
MEISAAARAAEQAGLKGFAVTDHLDLKAPGGETRFAFSPTEQQEVIDSVQKETGVKIYKGVEIGLQPDNLEEISTFLKGYSFDTVVASVHFVDGEDPYHGNYYEGLSEKEAYGRYLELMYQLLDSYGDFDVLGHYDYIARYAPYDNRTIRYRDYPDLFDEIFRLLAQNGKALEINSNTYRKRDNRGVPEPDFDVFKRFLEIGGEFVSFGSDAHTPDRMGENSEKYILLAKRAGLRYITHYEGRKPIPFSLSFL